MRAHRDDLLSELLEQAGRGDVAAFGAVVRSTSGLSHSVALRVVGDRDHADEVLQEAYFEIWSKAALFDRARSGASSWITMTVRHRAIDRARRLRSARRRAADYYLREYSPPHDTTTETAHRRLAAGTLHEALAGLGVEDRQVLHLSYWAGYSQAEIGAFLELPLGTVKSRMRRATIRLRASMAAELET